MNYDTTELNEHHPEVLSKLPLHKNNSLLNRLIVLGAGQPYRGEKHSALRETSKDGKVLDWLLHAVRELKPEIYFIGGYQIEEIAQRYPDFHYVVNPEWQATGAAASFLQSPLDSNYNYIISYADILFHDSAVKWLDEAEGDIIIAADRNWRERFAGRTQDDLIRCEKVHLHGNRVTRLSPDIRPELAEAEFIGLVKFSAKIISYLEKNSKDLLGLLRHANLSELIEILRTRGFDVRAVDLAGDWAELNEGRDLVHFVLGTKAQTLQRLSNLVTKSRIEDQVSFTVAKWTADSTEIMYRISKAFQNQLLAIRSSALSEDGFSTANAGAYSSVLNVNVTDESALRNAINTVVASYPDGNAANQVLVQPMVLNVSASGVIFTRTLSCGAPYFVINYDDSTKSTESITSGTSQEHKTLVLHRDYPFNNEELPPVIKNLIPALIEIEKLLEYDSLDIEFAVSENGCIHILQVRPIAVNHERWEISDKELTSLIETAKQQFISLQESSPFIVGKRAFFGVMPDWNPAEIIGTKPGYLAISLYRYLIMDEVWATQRAEFGYRDVRPNPLLVTFAGHPYVDIRASFNSFIPADLNENLAGRLVDFYLDWLERNPHLHDKVEFDVVPTCYDLNFSKWESRLTKEGGFSINEVTELEKSLKNITLNALTNNQAHLDSVEKMEQRRKHIMSKPTPPLERALILLEDCKRYGTLAFAHLARNAFVAISLLRSALESDVISKEGMDSFLSSIRTVTHLFTEDAKATATNELNWEEFVTRYGHLRPGTYDITSPCYKDNTAHFLAPIIERSKEIIHQPIDLSAWESSREKFLSALKKINLHVDILELEHFLRVAIEGREYAKFIFSKNVSAALDELAIYCNSMELSREEISHIPLEAFFSIRTGNVVTGDIGNWLKTRSQEGALAKHMASMIELPPLLLNIRDFQLFMYPGNQPNFIGNGRITAELIDLANMDLSNETSLNLAGKIIMIPQADPGYDWVFGQGISGLITMYGGANSHMAIRSAEFGLPAAIGIGETMYQRLTGAAVLELDAGNRQIRVVGR